MHTPQFVLHTRCVTATHLTPSRPSGPATSPPCRRRTAQTCTHMHTQHTRCVCYYSLDTLESVGPRHAAAVPAGLQVLSRVARGQRIACVCVCVLCCEFGPNCNLVHVHRSKQGCAGARCTWRSVLDVFCAVPTAPVACTTVTPRPSSGSDGSTEVRNAGGSTCRKVRVGVGCSQH